MLLVCFACPATCTAGSLINCFYHSHPYLSLSFYALILLSTISPLSILPENDELRGRLRESIHRRRLDVLCHSKQQGTNGRELIETASGSANARDGVYMNGNGNGGAGGARSGMRVDAPPPHPLYQRDPGCVCEEAMPGGPFT